MPFVRTRSIPHVALPLIFRTQATNLFRAITDKVQARSRLTLPSARRSPLAESLRHALRLAVVRRPTSGGGRGAARRCLAAVAIAVPAAALRADGMMMGGPGGGGGGAGRYSLNVSINVQNLFNQVNLRQPEGNINVDRILASRSDLSSFWWFRRRWRCRGWESKSFPQPPL